LRLTLNGLNEEVRMTAFRATNRTVAMIGLAVVSAGCGPDRSDASAVVGPANVQANAAKNVSAGSPAISDAISRILPAIARSSADALRGPLTTINLQVGASNTTALRAAISAARKELQVAFAIAADGPDLDGIALAIDSVEPPSP
jgi:hypothetical protein